jgi:hypothetical protein
MFLDKRNFTSKEIFDARLHLHELNGSLILFRQIMHNRFDDIHFRHGTPKDFQGAPDPESIFLDPLRCHQALIPMSFLVLIKLALVV